jgi:hypothetical protein
LVNEQDWKLQIANCKLQIVKRGWLSSLPRPLSISRFAICNLQFAIVFMPFGFLPSLHAAISIEPPIVGRPTHAPFSGGIGSFHPSATATPTEIQVVDPVTFTIHITADGSVSEAPRRPDLRELPAFAERFYIEDVATPDEAPSARQGWEFVYRLKPRDTSVAAVPSFPLMYYQPGMLPPAKGYMTRWASSIPLMVTPREQVKESDLIGGKPLISPPATIFQFANGEEILCRDDPGTLPGPVVLSLLALVPPVGCMAWFLTWRRLYPDAARQTKQRRSRAARNALQQLRASRRIPRANQPERAAGIVTDYLRRRLDLPAAEATPIEVAAHFQRMGLAHALAERAVRFFRDCDAARFRPSPSSDWPAVETAAQLILAVEDASWQL